MTYNYGKLKERIRMKYGTFGRFARAMGMHPNSLVNKLMGHTQWRQCEMAKACKLLGIKKLYIGEYFFSEKV